MKLYKYQEHQLIMPEDFFLPFGGKLNKENRWVKLAQMIPWWKVEEMYAGTFKKASTKGNRPFSARLALGALIIQQRQGTTDRETVQQITENAYMQYFLGLPAFQEHPPFHHSMMTHFRKRLEKKDIDQINEWLVLEEHQEAESEHKEDDDHTGSQPSVAPAEENKGTTLPTEQTASSKKEAPATLPTDAAEEVSTVPPTEALEKKEQKNQGKLLLDATCAPADIAYPTDLSLLNQAREKLERMIDELYEPVREQFDAKPRTYRKKAHQAYLSVAKQRRPGAGKRRKAVGKQLRFIRRDLRIIKNLAEKVSLSILPATHYRYLLVIHELYRQQNWMYQHHTNRIDDRIVSLSQSHVRPIVRGKARTKVEFGAKVAISMVHGDALIERLDWNNFNESHTLQEAVETYKRRFGFYPEAVLADQLYRNRDNLKYCKKNHIRLSGPKLGRKSKQEQVQKAERKVERSDFKGRIPVEGKFGEAKRRYGLDRIYTMLRKTSETAIALKFLVMNLERRLRASLRFFRQFKNIYSIYGIIILSSNHKSSSPISDV